MSKIGSDPRQTPYRKLATIATTSKKNFANIGIPKMTNAINIIDIAIL